MNTRDNRELHLGSYIAGFLLSIALTLTAYFIVVNHVLSRTTILAGIGVLAIVQLLVQLFFFLHLGHEKRPHWKLVAFLFMLTVLVILVVGSLWIMYNLNYHTLSPQQVDSYMHHEEGIH